MVKSSIQAKGTDISVLTTLDNEDYISLTDIARYKSDEPFITINNWMRRRDTIEFLGLWEQLNNPNFKPIEFDRFKVESGANSFTLSPQKWITSTNAKGIIAKSGRYGGTFAHKDIAFEFASWISAEFKLYIIQDYQRLKADESHKLSLDWSVKRIIAKANYRIHTDAIKNSLIPPQLTKQQQGLVYAEEADLLNVALFGVTAKQWRENNPELKGNIRDYATIEQLLVLSNLENLNAVFIDQGKPQSERILLLNKIAIQQLSALENSSGVKQLQDLDKPDPKKLKQ